MHRNQTGTTRGHLAATRHSHKMFAGWELPTSHCMIVAVGKGKDRAHGKSVVCLRVKKLRVKYTAEGTPQFCTPGLEPTRASDSAPHV